jgi:hypothetical protein
LRLQILQTSKLKNPVFKPYQVIKTSQTPLQSKNDFFKAIIVPDTPQVSNNPSTSTNQINTIQNYQIDHVQTSDDDIFQKENLEINKLL